MDFLRERIPQKVSLISFFGIVLVYATTADILAQSRPELGVRIDVPVHGPMVVSRTLEHCQCGVYSSTPRHIGIGASVSLPLFSRMRLGLDPEYQRIGVTETSVSQFYQNGINSPLGTAVGKTGTTANRWRLPVLMEAEVSRHIRLGIGPVASVVTDSRTILRVTDSFGLDSSRSVDDARPRKQGIFGVGAAVEFPFRLVAVIVAPEVRYNRWTTGHYGQLWAMDEVSVGLAIRR